MGLFTRTRPVTVATVQRGGRAAFQALSSASPMSAAPTGEAVTGINGQAAKGASTTAWLYYDEVGELRQVGDFLGACFSRITLRPGWLDDDDNPSPLLDEDGKLLPDIKAPPEMIDLARNLIRALRSVPGGRAAFMKALGQNLGVASDCYAVGDETRGADGRGYGRHFEVLSVDELRPIPKNNPDDPNEKQRYKRLDKPGGNQGTELPETASVLRIWDPHPRLRRVANPFSRPLLTTLEAMRLLTLEHLSQSRSRLKGPGVYWIDDSIDIPTEDEQTEEEAFTLSMVKVFSTAIGDPGSAAANVPIIMRAPRDAIQNGIRLDRFDLNDERTLERRNALTEDFARGAPFPPEVVMGHAQTTFANAFSIDESTMKIYVASPLELACGHLSAGYLQPSLLADMADQVKSDPSLLDLVSRFVVWYDDSQLVVHPDRAKNAQVAVGTERSPNFVLSLPAARRYQGFRESDAPDEDEIAERLRRAQLLNARETLQGLVPEGQDAPGGPEDTTGTPNMDGPSPGDASSVPTPAVNGNGQAGAYDRLAMALTDAADYAADRAVKRLDSRLVDRMKRDPVLTTAARNSALASGGLAQRLGVPEVRRLLGDDLWSTEFAAFADKARQWAKDHHHPKPELVAARAKTMAEKLATERLFDPKYRITPEQVKAILK